MLLPKCALLVLVSLCLAWAQSDANKGTITGTVYDPNQAVIPNARVNVSNTGTGLTRDTTTNEAGQYRFAALDPGTYQVKVDAPGFATATATNIVVTVGGSTLANVTVALQPTTQTVDVSESLVQVTEANPSQVVNLQAIENLPINGRRFQDFATLTPTVQVEPTRQQLSFVGQRGVNSNVMVDGTDYNEPFFGGIRGGERSNFAFTLPQSAVQEFQAVTAGYAPEYGRSTGGVLNAVTRSGSNDLHGDLFYQLRHKELGLKNPLNQQSLETQHQFGGGVGGPIKRDKLFFFGAAERQLATFPRLVYFANLDQFIGNITPDIAPAYNYLRSLETPFGQTNDAWAVFGRVDYQFANGSRLTGRYNHSDNNAANAASTGTSLNPQTNFALSNNGTEKDNTNTAVAQFTSVISAATVNDLRVEYSREGRPRLANQLMPTVNMGPIGQFGTRNFLPTTASNYRVQIADAVTTQHGNHSVKLGFDYDYLQAGQSFGFNQFGYFNFTGTSDIRRILQIMSRSGGAAGSRFDDSSVIYQRQIGNLALNTNMHEAALFAQDSWKVRSNVTLNYGLRWEAQFNPQPVANNDFLIQNVRDVRFPLGGTDPTKIANQFRQFAPRLGVAWDATGDGKTVVRADTGLFFAQTPIIIYSTPLNNFRIPPGDLSITVSPTGTATIYQKFLAAGVDLNQYSLDKLPVIPLSAVQAAAGATNPYAKTSVITTSANNYRNPRAFQVNAGVQREVLRGLIVDYEFYHVITDHLERNLDINVPLPFVRPGDLSQRPFFGLRSGTPRPNPNLDSILLKDSSARSNYNGHSFRVQFRKQRFQFAGNYTLSYNKSDSDEERTATGIYYQNPFDLGREYNWSSLDARHQVGAYTVWTGWWGIELTGLFRYRSALPIDPSTGGDTSELGSQSGSVGNRPLIAPGVPMLRNSFRNRPFKTFDARFLKSIPVHERYRVQFSCEMFNVFNWANMAINNTSGTCTGCIYGMGIQTNGQPAPVDARFLRLRLPNGAYDPSTTAQQGVPFQAQLGLRLIF